jgi:hypothetical protein
MVSIFGMKFFESPSIEEQMHEKVAKDIIIKVEDIVEDLIIKVEDKVFLKVDMSIMVMIKT